jgi:N-hydroxyarylamine O-acetyltransferase
MEVQKYLDRLGVAVTGGPSLDALRSLHEAHLLNISFENLDIHRGVEIVLDEDKILDKIIEGRRGGFCYELNASFAWLLSRLGYEVTMLSAEVARDEGGFGIPFDHMTLLVGLDRAWLADVGFGDCFRFPLPLEAENESEQLGERFRLMRDGSWWIVERRSGGEQDFCPLYRFTLEPHELADFAEACHYHQTSPESTFTQGTICTRALLDGRVTLHPDRLATTRGGIRTEEPIRDPEQWEAVLEENFGIAQPRLRKVRHGRQTS